MVNLKQTKQKNNNNNKKKTQTWCLLIMTDRMPCQRSAFKNL